MEALAIKEEKNSYLEIGELLRRARESARLPIDHVARMLHMRVRYLDAMEQGRFEELPGLPYARGYIQSYAQFLGLDKDEILRRMEDIDKAMTASRLYIPQVLSQEKSPRKSFVWGGLLAALAVYVLWSISVNYSNKTISVAEKFPVDSNGIAQISEAAAQDVACLRTKSEVYPPCVIIDEPDFRVTPWPQKINSVMELAVIEQAE